MASLGNRIVVLIDMDCFFCQVETRLQPQYAGKPLAVVQYNLWRQGGIIAVNYEAREFGVTRHMRGDEAKEKCPDIVLATVPCLRGKADTSRYRSAGREVIEVLRKNCSLVERASVDEAYLDITQMVDKELAETGILEDYCAKLNTSYVVGYSDDKTNNEEQRLKGLNEWLSNIEEDEQIHRLAIAGCIVEKIRRDVFETTGFECSAGISFNKILAKLACGLHKPNRQTILPAAAVPDLFLTLPVKKVRHLGGKLGDTIMESLKCNVMSDLLRFSLQYLQNRFDEKNGLWLYNIARGNDNEPVTPRLVSKSIGACKKFPGKQAIDQKDVLRHWLGELAAEVCERLEQDLEENERRATLMTVTFQMCEANNKNIIAQSRSCPLISYKVEKMVEQCFSVVTKASQQKPIAYLGISVGKFVKAKGSETFVNYFKQSDGKTNTENKLSLSESEVQVPDLEEEEEQEEEERAEQENIQVNDYSKNETKTEKELIDDNGKDAKTEKELRDNSRNDENVNLSLKLSPCTSVQNNLKPENFKKSFFVNILKEKRPKEEPQTREDNRDVETESVFEEKNSNSKRSLCFNNTFETTVKTDVSELNTSNEEPLERLREIFPDFDDIDLSVVQLLPQDLQEAAKKIMGAKKVKLNKNIKKSGKVKVQKSVQSSSVKTDSNENAKKPPSNRGRPRKIVRKQSQKSVQNFFIRTDLKDREMNLKKCSACDQWIEIKNFISHNDFHVAQNLQSEISRTLDREDNKKRKIE